jgi:lysophospholipase L1-like esterase
MRNRYLLFSVLFIAFQAGAQTVPMRFDFGAGRTMPGYARVTTDTKYSDETGYGFDKYSTDLLAGDGKTKNALLTDFISSTKPFYFSIKLPDGNYDVKVILGDPTGIADATLRAECRRLMVEKVTTSKGKFATVNFTVHVKDSLIRNEKNEVVNKVRIKEREIGYLHWDNKLTLEFNGPAPKVCAVEITSNTKATTVFLAGNSTVVDQDKEPWAAWGQMIPSFFQAKKIAIANYAESGEALNSFRSARRLEKILSLMKKGDYLFIEFGHNDMKQKGEGIGAFTSYKKEFLRYIADVKAKGGIPVVVTSMHRRSFDSTGHIINTLGDYPEAARQAAKETNTALIDLNAMSKILYEAWGPVQSIKAFVHYPANTFPGQDKKLEDNTHFNTYGAWQIAKCIVKGIKEAKLGIATSLRKDLAPFDPAHPDAIDKLFWPMGAYVTGMKPDGN